MSFPENLQVIRIKNKLSQEKLAELMNVSRQAVAKWEGGKSYPDIKKLLELSRLFNVSVDELLNEAKVDSCKFTMANVNGGFIMDKNIIDFICRAKKYTYASGRAEDNIPCRAKSHDFEYIEGNLRYLDSYLGSSNFSGEEVVWKDGTPIWSMNYIGRVFSEEFSGSFLKEVLSNVNSEYPYRGPLEYKKDNFMYKSTITGEVNWFCGHEEIFKDDTKVYECNFHGCVLV